MSQQWQAAGNTVSDLTGPRNESQISGSREEHITTRPTDQTQKSEKTILWYNHIATLSEISDPFAIDLSSKSFKSGFGVGLPLAKTLSLD